MVAVVSMETETVREDGGTLSERRGDWLLWFMVIGV